MFTWDNFKKLILEWLKTFSQRASLFSSKKMERFVFGGFYILMCTAYMIYAIEEKTLEASDIVLIGSPLLIAAGYNLAKTEKEKTDNKEG